MKISPDSLRPLFTNAKSVNEDVIRAERRHEGSIFEIHYFDTSEAILQKGFDIDRYQYEILGEDYYSKPESQQSSYYLNFVIPEGTIQSITQDNSLTTILENRSFARKRVLSDSDFKQLLENEIAAEPTNVKNPADEWETLLAPYEMEFVLNKRISRQKTVGMIQDGTRKAQGYKRKSREEYSAPFPKIKFMNLRNYRPILQNSKFRFGKVNLITGPNAVGKTSLLEAIELAICGKTIRNPEADSIFRFNILFAGDDADNPNEVSNLPDKEYRSRDRYWYGRHYRSGNELYKSFARFNFFDADAAIRFSNDLVEGNITEALEGIVFGYDSKELEKHIVGIYSELERLNKKVSKECADFKILEEELEVQLRSDGVSRGSSESTDRISAEELKRIGVITDKELPVEEVQRKLGELEIEASILSQTQSIPLTTRVRDLENLVTETRRIQSSLNTSQRREDAYKREMNKLIAEIQPITVRLEMFEHLQSYSREVINDIRFIETQVRDGKNKLSLAHNFVEEISNIFPNDLPNGKSTVEESVINLKEQLNELQVDLSKLERERSSLEGLITEKTRALLQVKQEALELVNSEKLDNCPVCETHHGLEELVQIIQNSLSTTDPSSESHITSILQNEADKKKGIDRVSNNLKKLESLTSILKMYKFDWKVSLDRISDKIVAARDSIPRIEANISDNQNILLEHKKNKHTLEDYENTCQDLGIADVDEEKLSITIASLRERVNSNSQKMEKLQASSADEHVSQERLLRSVHWFIGDVTDREDIDLHYQRLEKLYKATESLGSFFVLNENTTLNLLANQIVETQSLLLTLLDLRERNLRLSQTEAELINVRERRRISSQIKKNIEAPIEVLGNLISKHRLNDMLSEFLTNNEKSIRNTFLKLHSPQEFSDLSICDGSIILSRKSGEKAEVTNLSTGQRTALALSFFLTLNASLKDAPQMILFDDPIAYIDDLNILTFLDYLRNFSITSNRQIFFATANRRLSGLFHRKFEFLGDDFSFIKLSREETLTADKLH